MSDIARNSASAISEILTIALALARRGYPVFPCALNKRPTTPAGENGTGGYRYATTDPAEVTRLWQRYPGELIGLRTGSVSNLDVLDIDDPAWFVANADAIPETRTYRTRRGGLHLYFRHHPGLRLSQGLIAPKVDVRADGSYAIFWFGHGFECTDGSPIAPWPSWLVERATRRNEPPASTIPPEPIQPVTRDPGEPDNTLRYERFAAKLLDRLSAAGEGTKHTTLLSCGRAIGGILAEIGWSTDYATHQLLNVLPNTGSNAVRDWTAADRTARAAIQHGAQNPIQLTDRPYAREVAA